LKFVHFAAPLVLALCFSNPLARAQANVDVFFGLGTAQASSSGQSIDTFGTGNYVNTPHLGGTFGKIGADLMLTPHFGVGGETDLRFSQSNYAGLNYRPVFYDFNAIYAPVKSFKRIVPQFQAGLGVVNLKFYYPQQQVCDPFAGCSSSNAYLESSNHFQVHVAAGLRFYASRHLFLQPQIDAHYVNNFFQFGSNWVPEYSASVGWSFGSRE
jgi:outer membrane protein W